MTAFAADQHSSRLSTRRAESVTVDDSGEFQRMTGDGYDSEQFKLAHRVQPFGLTSHPPKGSHGLAVLANGRPDQTVLLGVEHPDYRPKNTPEGATKLYDKDGTFVYLDAAGNLHAKTRLKLFGEAGQEAHIKAPAIKLEGNVEITGNLSIANNLHVGANITHVGNMTTGGVHVDANGVHV